MNYRSPGDHPDPGPPSPDAPVPEGSSPEAPSRPAVGLLGVVLVVTVLAVTGGVLAVRTWSFLQFRRPSTLGLAGVSELVMAMLTVLALAAGTLAWRGRARGGALWLVAAVVPLAILVQTVWPTAVGVLRPENADGGTPLRIVAQNLWRENPDPDHAARTILSLDADVLVLTELTPRQFTAFQRAGAEADYPYRVVRARPDSDGMAVLSNVPFRAGRQPSSSRTEVVLRPAGARPVDLIAVHLPSATRVGMNVWEEAYAELADVVSTRGTGLVVAGDFNATSGLVPFRNVAAVGELRDAQDVGGGGFRATWSEVVRPVPPLLRLDHVLVGPAFGVGGFAFAPLVGSDHRGVIADLSLPDAP